MIPCTSIITRCKASCCGIVPFSKPIYAKHQDHRCVPEVDLLEVTDIVIPITKDLRCIFLNRETHQCSIYLDRPKLCSIFGYTDGLLCIWCDEQGNERTRSERRRLERTTDQGILTRVKRLKHTISKKQEVLTSGSFEDDRLFQMLHELCEGDKNGRSIMIRYGK